MKRSEVSARRCSCRHVFAAVAEFCHVTPLIAPALALTVLEEEEEAGSDGDCSADDDTTVTDDQCKCSEDKPCSCIAGHAEAILVAAQGVRHATEGLEKITAVTKPKARAACVDCPYGRTTAFVTDRLLRVFSTPESCAALRNFAFDTRPEVFDRTHGCGSCGRSMSRKEAFKKKSSIPWLPSIADIKLDKKIRSALTHASACQDCREWRSACTSPFCRFRPLSGGYVAGGMYAALSPLVHPVSPYVASTEVRGYCRCGPYLWLYWGEGPVP